MKNAQNTEMVLEFQKCVNNILFRMHLQFYVIAC